MRKKKISYYCVATFLGGAERSLLELLLTFHKNHDIDFEVLLPRPTGPLLEEFARQGIDVKVISMPEFFLATSRSRPFLSVVFGLISLPKLVLYCWKLSSYFKKNRFDYIHTTGIKCHFLSILSTFGSKQKVVIHLRDIFKPGMVKLLLNFLVRVSRSRVKVLANSQSTKKSFDQRLKLDVDVIYNGLDLNLYPRRGVKSKDKNRKLRVGIIGVIAPWKGQSLFLQMAEQLVKRAEFEIEFLIVGDQIYDTSGDKDFLQKLKQSVGKLQLERNVKFLGFQRNIVPILQSLDVLVHASILPEPFGRVLIEAQACGVPVVASNFGGPVEIITNGANGLLVNPGDAVAFADAVERILRDKSLQEKLIVNGYKGLQDRFSMETHRIEMLKAFGVQV